MPTPKAKTKEKKLDPKKIKKEIKAISKGEKKAADKEASTKSKITGKKVAPSKSKKPSKVSSGSISMYLAEIGKYNPLPPEREVELAIRIQNNDESAMKELVEANLRFVVSVAKNIRAMDFH